MPKKKLGKSESNHLMSVAEQELKKGRKRDRDKIADNWHDFFLLLLWSENERTFVRFFVGWKASSVLVRHIRFPDDKIVPKRQSRSVGRVCNDNITYSKLMEPFPWRGHFTQPTFFERSESKKRKETDKKASFLYCPFRRFFFFLRPTDRLDCWVRDKKSRIGNKKGEKIVIWAELRSFTRLIFAYLFLLIDVNIFIYFSPPRELPNSPFCRKKMTFWFQVTKLESITMVSLWRRDRLTFPLPPTWDGGKIFARTIFFSLFVPTTRKLVN